MTVLSLDFETRSTVDLRRTGVYPYAQHPHTGIWCCAYAVDDNEVELWTPDQPVPDVWLQGLQERWEFRAWNAQFERVIWNLHGVPRLGFPRVPLEFWHDTAAEAAAMALPRALGQCAEVLRVEFKKDQQGHNLMLRMARPRSMKGRTPIWWTDPMRQQRLFEYCKQDVRTERAVYQKVRRLTPHEREIYLLDQRMNDRGVLIDTLLVEAAREVAEEGLERANALIAELTNGGVKSVTNVADLTRWLQYQSVEVDNVAKSTVRDLLERDDIGGDARRVLEIRAEFARSSVAKLDAMMQARCVDDRVRGLLLYHGASTGRWAGKLVQPQNFPRGEVEEVEQYINLVLDRNYEMIDLIHPPLVVVSSLLRGCLIPAPGKQFFVADFAQIEARVLAWLAGQDDLVAMFASGGKVYEEMAAKIFDCSPNDIEKGSERRQIGKATVLGCGFGMGGEKFQSTARSQYGVSLSREQADKIVDVYRGAYPKIVEFWNDLSNATFNAIRAERHNMERDSGEPKQSDVYSAGRVKMSKRGAFLWVGLPSHRTLAYAMPNIEPMMTPWKEMRPTVTYMGINSYTRKWTKQKTYGGHMAENVTQAVARDLLADAMLRVETAGYDPVLSVHDEVICEAPLDKQHPFDTFMSLMQQTPDWAPGCPVAAEGWYGERYRKD